MFLERISMHLFLLLLKICFSYEQETVSLLMPDVQPFIKDAYLCTAFEMPKDDHEYIVSFQPRIAETAVNHIMVYGCEYPGSSMSGNRNHVWNCDKDSNRTSRYPRGPVCYNSGGEGKHIVYVWALKAPPLDLPYGVGFKVGKGSGINYLVLQIHYDNVEKFINGGTDHSGVKLTVRPSSDKTITKSAGVFGVKTDGEIPPKSQEHMETAYRIDQPVKLHPFAYRTHTHNLGKIVAGYKIDKNGKWELIAKRNPLTPQAFYPIENENLTLCQGDILAARCTMYNFRDRVTYIGSAKEDEMCNFYILYYVEEGELLNGNLYASDGPPTYYWRYDPKIASVPFEIDRDASTLDQPITEMTENNVY